MDGFLTLRFLGPPRKRPLKCDVVWNVQHRRDEPVISPFSLRNPHLGMDGLMDGWIVGLMVWLVIWLVIWFTYFLLYWSWKHHCIDWVYIKIQACFAALENIPKPSILECLKEWPLCTKKQFSGHSITNIWKDHGGNVEWFLRDFFQEKVHFLERNDQRQPVYKGFLSPFWKWFVIQQHAVFGMVSCPCPKKHLSLFSGSSSWPKPLKERDQRNRSFCHLPKMGDMETKSISCWIQ